MTQCNHPNECLDGHGECVWCAEVKALWAKIYRLREQVAKGKDWMGATAQDWEKEPDIYTLADGNPIQEPGLEAVPHWAEVQEVHAS